MALYTYVSFKTDDHVRLAGLFRTTEEIEDYRKVAEDDGYDNVQIECTVPLTVSGSTRKDRKRDFLNKVNDLVKHAEELVWWQEDEITEWIEKNAIRTGSVRELRELKVM